MNPEQLQCELVEKLNAHSQPQNRLLYDIDYDEEQVIAAAKELLGRDAFPLLPRLGEYRLLIFAAFASAMANDELAEYDTFYNRLSEIFFENAPTDVNRQNQIRDFVEETCERFNLRFLRNQNRFVRNTIWLHGGLPSRHWQSFFERVLMRVDEDFGNLNQLLNFPTPRTIKRFFDHCGNSARAFLRDCVEMREAGLSGELDSYSAKDLDVSENFLNAFREFLKGKDYKRRQRQRIVFDATNLRIIDERTGQAIQPNKDIYAFRANGKRNFICRGYKELPRKPVILIYHKDFTIPATIRRIVEKESLTGVWKDYVCEWLDLINQTELRLEHRADNDKNFTIDVVETPNLELEESPVQLAGRSVFCKADFEEVEVYNAPPTLRIEHLSPQQRERARIVVNNREINITSHTIPLAPYIAEGISEIRLRGARGALTLKMAYFPNFNPQLDKAEYFTDETPMLFIDNERFARQRNGHRVEIKFKGFVFSIPIPRKAWRITDKEWSSEPLSLRAQDLPSSQAQRFLEIAHTASNGKLIAKSGETDLLTTLLRFEDGFCKVDLVHFKDIANANQEVELYLSLEGAEAVPVLRIYREWQPKIACEVNGKTVKFRITDNVAGFKNREIVCWNLCRLWEKPIVVSIPDGATEVEYAFEHDGEYVIEPRVEQTGWSKPKEPSPFDVPADPPKFRIGNKGFNDYRQECTMKLLSVLLSQNAPTPIAEGEFLATLVYMVKSKESQTVDEWLHLFLAIRKEIRERFQTALYANQHTAIQQLKQRYEEMIINSIVNQKGIVTISSSKIFNITPELRAEPYRQKDFERLLDGFMLRWKTNGNVIRLTNVDNNDPLKNEGLWFVRTESLEFYTLICSQNEIATVAVARKPLILCFQADQLDNARFRLIWRVLKADEVEITSEITPIGTVDSEGEAIVTPKHGQKFTLTAINQTSISEKSIETKFAPPFIKSFRLDSVQDGYIKLTWETLRADTVRIEPSIGPVEPSGIREIAIQPNVTRLTLVAENKADKVEKKIEVPHRERQSYVPAPQAPVIKPKSPENSSQQNEATKPNPPCIEVFKLVEVQNGQAKIAWQILNADEAYLEPSRERVEPSGEKLLPLTDVSGMLQIVAKNKIGEEKKRLQYGDYCPDWFRKDAWLELDISGSILCAKVFEMFQITKKLLFKGQQRIGFDILHATEDTVILALIHQQNRIITYARPSDKRELSTFNFL